MAIKKYSKRKHGEKKLSEHFKVGEFGCPGTDKILIDTRLAPHLEKIRKHFGGRVNITSGYRSTAHNRKVGGSWNSRHLTGRAVDIQVFDSKGKIVPSKLVMCYAQDIGFIGIGYISPTACHLDFKTGAKYRYDETKFRGGYFLSFSDCYKYFGVKRPAKKIKGTTMYINTPKSRLKVRNKASLGGRVIGYLKDNSKVIVVEKKDGWSRVGSGKWVATKYLSGKK